LGDGPRDEAVGEIPTNNSAAILARTQARTDNDYYESGLPPNLLGGETNQDTATGQTQQLSNANKKIVLVIRNLAFTLFLPAFKYLLRLEQAYETEEYIKGVLGAKMGPLIWDTSVPVRDILQGDFDVQVNFGVDKKQQINKILLIADRMTQANQATAQLVQTGVMKPQDARFGNPMRLFDELLKISGIKKTDDFEIQATPPPPQEGAAPGGSPSAPRPILDTAQPLSNMLPSMPGRA
jgi:hypothetical protein